MLLLIDLTSYTTNMKNKILKKRLYNSRYKVQSYYKKVKCGKI